MDVCADAEILGLEGRTRAAPAARAAHIAESFPEDVLKAAGASGTAAPRRGVRRA